MRDRLLRAILAVLVVFLCLFPWAKDLYSLLAQPLLAVLPQGGQMIATDVVGVFLVPMKVALLIAFVIALPYVLYQVWAFVAPGLYAHEKKMALPFILMSSGFFVSGAAFSHYVVFPLTWKFFVSFTSDYLTFMPRIEPAFSLYIKMLLAFGLVFQMPTIVLFLARMGVVTAGFLWRQIKYAILAIFIIAAVITPSGDMFTQTAMAAPMIGLYLLSILLAWIFGKKPKRNEDIPYEI